MTLLVVSTQTTLPDVMMTTRVLPTPATMSSVVPVFPYVATTVMLARTILATPKLDALTPRQIAPTTVNVTRTAVIPRVDAQRWLFNAMTVMPVQLIIATTALDV
jgi:hypothetical protein